MNHPIVKDWKLGSPARIDYDSVTTYRGDYSKARNFSLASAYPIVEAYRDRAAVGARLNFMDPVGFHGADINVSYTPSTSLPDDERVHASATYRLWPWTFGATYNKADFYDFFGPTKRSRKGYSASVDYANFIIADKPRFLEYTIGASYYGGLDEHPTAQNVPATYEEFVNARAELSFKKLRRSIGAVEYEKGIRWDLGLYSNYVPKEFDATAPAQQRREDLNEFYAAGRARLDLGFLLP